MINTTFKKLSLIGTLAAAFTLVGCLQGEDSTAAASAPDVQISVSTAVGTMNQTGSLAKGNLISLNKLVIMLVSNATVADTIRDTITTSTTPSISATSTAAQTINKNYTVKGLRNWKVLATVYDANNTVTHSGATGFSPVKVSDGVAFPLTLNANYTMYEAQFFNLPDSISSSVGGTFKQKVNFKRLILRVDGATVRDSTHATFFAFGSGTSPVLSYDYVTTGSHTIRLIAMGNVGTTAFTLDTLYAGEAVINSSAGVDRNSDTIALVWKNFNTGTDTVRVTIGKVGKTTVTGTVGGQVVPKGSNK